MNIFRTFWQSIKDLFEELFLMATVNFIWVLISAPLAALAVTLLFSGATVLGVLVSLLAVLPMAPANAGLYTVVQRVCEGRVSSWRVFFEGFRQNLSLSVRVYGLWALGLVAILFNLRFYQSIGSLIGAILLSLFFYILLVWMSLLIYIGPLMLLQQDKRIHIIARNALLMAVGRPLFTIVTLIMMSVIVVVSIWLPILPLVATFAFLAIWSFRATTTLVDEAEARRAAQAEQAAANRPNTEKGRGGQVRPRD